MRVGAPLLGDLEHELRGTVAAELHAAEEELAAVRPELNGHQISEVLGIPPGPVLGEAYDHLLQFRLDAGPVGPEAAAEEPAEAEAEKAE